MYKSSLVMIYTEFMISSSSFYRVYAEFKELLSRLGLFKIK